MVSSSAGITLNMSSLFYILVSLVLADDLLGSPQCPPLSFHSFFLMRVEVFGLVLSFDFKFPVTF